MALPWRGSRPRPGGTIGSTRSGRRPVQRALDEVSGARRPEVAVVVVDVDQGGRPACVRPRDQLALSAPPPVHNVVGQPVGVLVVVGVQHVDDDHGGRTVFPAAAHVPPITRARARATAGRPRSPFVTRPMTTAAITQAVTTMLSARTSTPPARPGPRRRALGPVRRLRASHARGAAAEPDRVEHARDQEHRGEIRSQRPR